jgi:LacI family transcriptional regulator
MMARGLSSKRTGIIGVMIPYNGALFRSTFVNEVLSGIQTELFRNGYSMMFLPTKGEDSPTMVRNQLQVAHGYDGLILFGTRYCRYEDFARNIDQLCEADMPFAVVNMPEMPKDINQVILPTAATASQSPIHYLLQTGHREIVIIAGRQGNPETDDTVDHYREALERYGLSGQNARVLYGDFERDIARSEVLRALKRAVQFTAIYAMTDTMAAGAYEALGEWNLSVPEDVSVIGTNDSFFSAHMAPPMTTLRKPLFAGGEEAARLLLRTLNTGQSGRTVWLDGEIVLRGSVKVLGPTERVASYE